MISGGVSPSPIFRGGFPGNPPEIYGNRNLFITSNSEKDKPKIVKESFKNNEFKINTDINDNQIININIDLETVLQIIL